ncbi:MAG TPA: hypothetical protein VLL52_17275 [Anaerolineae bacterium]|nr:hypothetical protein [Anaerolineae bacterium]
MTPKIAKIPHDALFKELLRRFLPEVIMLFLPQQAEAIQWETMKFIDKELDLNLPESLRRIADIVVEVKRADGQPETILLHIEVEASRKDTLPQRMFEYYSLLRLLKQQFILPVVMMLLPVGDDEIKLQAYHEKIGTQTYMTFEYWQVNLRDLVGDDYAARLDPIAATLSAVMPTKQLAQARLNSWRTIINNNQLTWDEKCFLIFFTDTYIPLSSLDDLGEDLMNELTLLQEEFLYDPYRIGLRQGREEGLLSGMKTAIRQILTDKFDQIPSDWEERLTQVNNLTVLEELLAQVLEANEISDMSWKTSENHQSEQQ